MTALCQLMIQINYWVARTSHWTHHIVSNFCLLMFCVIIQDLPHNMIHIYIYYDDTSVWHFYECSLLTFRHSPSQQEKSKGKKKEKRWGNSKKESETKQNWSAVNISFILFFLYFYLYFSFVSLMFFLISLFTISHFK